MANTYTQLYIHIVFAVNGRMALIRDDFREELHKYITGIVTTKGHKLLAINSVKDHIHILVGLNPKIALSDLVRDVKNNSSAFINKKGWIKGKFSWQKGFGAFSYSRSHVDAVIEYIRNQEQHHRKRTFKEEYVEFLKKFSIPYDTKYIFEDEKDWQGQ